jgi:hypothetical protein
MQGSKIGIHEGDNEKRIKGIDKHKNENLSN